MLAAMGAGAVAAITAAGSWLLSFGVVRIMEMMELEVNLWYLSYRKKSPLAHFVASC